MMRGIQYLPLDCMVQSLVGINGVVIRRSELVAALDLASDAALMELAFAFTSRECCVELELRVCVDMP